MKRETTDNKLIDKQMIRKRLGVMSVAAVFMIWLILGFTPSVAAQGLSFAVPELRMQVFVQPDASAHIVYDISFFNSPSGQAIDIIDIGTPHEDYNLQNMSASIDGAVLSDLRPSEVVDPGVEIHLHERSIPPGGEGTLHFEFTMPDMVFQDTTRDDYASLEITPTWFGSDLVFGESDVWIVVHMLPEVLAEEVLYQSVPFTDKALFEEHAVASWRWPNGSAASPNLVGLSFPQRGMTAIVEQSLLEITAEWLKDNPGIRFALAGLSVILFAVAFFRFTGGTGITVFAILVAGLSYLMYSSPLSVLLVLPGSIALVALGEWARSKRKTRYLPAIAQVEGGGIKRGLTAPEAAVILELPLNKVLTLIVFGLLEKGVVLQTNDTPLNVDITPEFRTVDIPGKKKQGQRLKVAQQLGVIIRKYEHAFLDEIEKNLSKAVQDMDFGKPMERLIQSVADRMKGFDLSDTQDYYRKIIQRAMREAQGIGEIPDRERYLDRHLQWLLLDNSYPTVLTTRSYHYRPIWVRPFASSDRIGMPAASGGRGASSYSGQTSFGDVAASFAGWTENTMGNLASSIAPGALQLQGPSGVVNLGGVDKVTGDVFKSLTTSSGSGGSGSGGGCACACAGCACACACAGGGR